MEPVLSNVEVLTYSLASRILLDDETNVARAIQVERFGRTLQYFASNEVILSAGAIGTPQGLGFSEFEGMIKLGFWAVFFFKKQICRRKIMSTQLF